MGTREWAIELWDAVTAGAEHGMKLAGVDAILLVRLESGLVLPDLVRQHYVALRMRAGLPLTSRPATFTGATRCCA